MPFAATWMDLDIIILNEVRQRQYHMMSLMCEMLKKKKETNELICKTETESQTLKADLWLPGGGNVVGRDKLEVLD